MNLGTFRALEGRFDEARRLIAEARALFEELGLEFDAIACLERLAELELLFGDLRASEQGLRVVCEASRKTGEKNYLADTIGQLAYVVYRQSREAEAEALAYEAAGLARSDNFLTHASWRVTRAGILARRGQGTEAKRLLREALARLEPIQMPQTRGEILMEIAEVFDLLGAREAAVSHAREALRLFDEKGSLVYAGRARTLLAQLERHSSRVAPFSSPT